MRYFRLENIKEGMVLGRTMHDSKGTVLLHKGTSLKKNYLQTIANMQYTGLYIDDEFSKDADVHDVITADLRTGAFVEVKNVFTLAQKNMNLITAKNQKQVNDIVNNMIDCIVKTRGAIVNLMDLKDYDDYTFKHSVNVAVLSLIVGSGAGFKRDEMFNLGMAALFHDVGKMFINKEILNKPSKLTPQEFEEAKKHSELGYEFIKSKFNFSATTFIGIWQHHERYDGRGYPLKKEKKEIINFARIISIADVYDALTSKRPYAKPMLPSEAFEYIVANAGSQFDPEFVDIFKRRVATFPLGVSVELSNGMKGLVVKNNEEFMTRPMVKIFDECVQNGRRYIDLLNDKDALSITVLKML